MSQHSIDTFRRAVDAIGRGDVSIVEIVHPEVVFEPLRSATEGAFVGHDGVRRFIADTAETFELFEPFYPDIREIGDRLLAIGTIRMRGRGSGVESDARTAAVVEFRDGLIWRYKDYGEPRLAREAAGHRE
jgi:ketosteroid isomerase-like protein